MLIHYMKTSRVFVYFNQNYIIERACLSQHNQGRLKFQTALCLKQSFFQRLRRFTVIMSERVLFATTA